MRGESDRECRARGGPIPYNAKGSKTLKSFHSVKPMTGAVDASLKRGAGPLFRKRGGGIPEAFEREEKATGGAISGASQKPSAGRPGRKLGGSVAIGADLKPLTHPESPAGPKGRKHMSEGEKTP